MRNERILRFGSFEFELDALELRKAGRLRPLQPLPARMLQVLAERPGRLVTRAELRRQLWGENTFVDFDVALNAAVRKLRLALGETRESPRHLETLARRGYRLRLVDDHQTARRVTSLAVLPFGTTNAESEYLSDGITELIIQGVSQLAGIRKVIARSSVYRYRADDPLEVGRRFNVQAVLAGRVELTGDRIVVSAELLSSSDGHRIWGERYEWVATDAPLLPGEIVASVAEAIGEPKHHRGAKARSFPAYQLYLQGRYAWNKRPASGAVEKAIALFEESIWQDPGSALASVGLADSYNTLAAWESGSVAPRVGFEKAKEAATRALRLDPRSSEAHASLAYANLHYDWNLAAAERAFKRSLQLNANYSHAHHWYAHLLIAAGRVDEALAESRHLLELDPLDLIINVHLAWHYFMAGKPLDALHEARRVLDMERSFHWGWFFEGLALGELGERHDAVKKLERAVELSGRSTVMLSALGYACAAAGLPDEATRILHDLGDLARSRYVSAFEIALIHLALGDVDASFEWLDRAHDERSGWLPYLAMEPRLAPLRHDARFKRLLERIGLTRSLHHSPCGP
jgi:TolB-like protein